MNTKFNENNVWLEFRKTNEKCRVEKINRDTRSQFTNKKKGRVFFIEVPKISLISVPEKTR